MLTDKMVNDIIDPEKKSLEVGHLKPGEFDLYWGGWSIRVNTEAQQLTGYTTMDNFGMYEYLEKLGLDMDKIDIDDDNRW